MSCNISDMPYASKAIRIFLMIQIQFKYYQHGSNNYSNKIECVCNDVSYKHDSGLSKKQISEFLGSLSSMEHTRL